MESVLNTTILPTQDKGRGYKYPQVIESLERQIEERSQGRAQTAAFLETALSTIHWFDSGSSKESLLKAGKMHAIRDLLRPGTLDKLELWGEDLKDDVVNFLMKEHSEALREWISDTMRRKNDDKRVTEMKELVSKRLSIPIGKTGTWGGL